MDSFRTLSFSVFVIFLSFVFFQIAGTFLFIALLGVPFSIDSFSLISDAMHNPANAGVLRTVQAVQSTGVFILPPFVIAYVLTGKRYLTFLGLNTLPREKSFFFSALMIIVSVPLINYLAYISSQVNLPAALAGFEQFMRSMEAEAEKLTMILVKSPDVPTLLINIVVIGIIPALGEELVFRGVLQKQIQNITGSSHKAVWISAFLFSVIHMQFYGFLSRLILGALLGYLYVWSRSLWLPVFAHLVNNASAVLFYFFIEKNFISGEYEKMVDTGISFQHAAVSCVLMIITAVLIFRTERQETEP